VGQNFPNIIGLFFPFFRFRIVGYSILSIWSVCCVLFDVVLDFNFSMGHEVIVDFRGRHNLIILRNTLKFLGFIISIHLLSIDYFLTIF